jgi:hypothetical protein
MIKDKNVQGRLTCEVCAKENDRCFEVRLGGEKHVFDSFECAMRAFAPHCGSCSCELVGHGIVLGDTIYCSYACANGTSTGEYRPRVSVDERAEF